MKRWPIIRHIRWLYLSWQLSRWLRLWSPWFLAASQSDLDYLDAVWRGDA